MFSVEYCLMLVPILVCHSSVFIHFALLQQLISKSLVCASPWTQWQVPAFSVITTKQHSYGVALWLFGNWSFPIAFTGSLCYFNFLIACMTFGNQFIMNFISVFIISLFSRTPRAKAILISVSEFSYLQFTLKTIRYSVYMFKNLIYYQ